jgi:hypothetical protein
LAASALTALAALTTVTALGAPSALAASQVTITTSYENSPISLNTSDAIGYAIKNTSGSPATVSFTDALPSGVTLDSPVGLTNTNGTGTCTFPTTPAPSPGASSVTLTVNAPSPSASGTVCTVSLSIVAGAPSGNDVPLPDAYSSVAAVNSSTQAPVSVSPTTAGLIVLSNPTLAFTAPTNNQTFKLGQAFDANFNCAATDPLDSIDSFFATDDEGNQIAPGAPIDTVDPGGRSLVADCYSAAGGGETLSQTIKYKVGSYTLTTVKTNKADHVSFKSTVPAGKFVAEVIDAKKVIGTTRLTVATRKTASITVKPTTAGKKLLGATKGNTAKVQLHVAFTPHAIGSGDSEISPAAATVVTRKLKLPIAHIAT